MREIDSIGLLLCKTQGDIFERSIDAVSGSSAMFIKRYMCSQYVARIDKDYYMCEADNIDNIYHELAEEYGAFGYGKKKYAREEMFWMGYIYRYMCYSYGITSKRAYNIISASALRKLYFAYHTLDPSKAIDMILEAQNINLKDKNKRGVEILRRIYDKNKNKA